MAHQVKQGDVIKGGPWDGFEVISVYTRAHAIEEGVLIDVSEWAKDSGFKYPAAVTTAVWELLTPSAHCRLMGESEKGRAHDMFWMLHLAIKRHTQDIDHILFDVKLGEFNVRLKGHCGPGDNAEPVITIMLPDED